MGGFDLSNIIFQTAASFINQTGKNLFLTGKAGTGKTTFLKYIREHSFKKMAVVAPTGVAAINAGGVTIHSLFQIPPGTFLPTQKRDFSDFDGKINNRHTLFQNMRMSSEKRDLLSELDLLIIDEVSMVRADLLDAIDTVLRHYRRQAHTPFGGVQVLYIGDLFQLPPVVRNEEWQLLKEFYKSPFFFDAQVMQEAPPVFIELKKIYRQSDNSFIDILNNVRNNCCTNEDLELLHQYYKPEFSPEEKENYITLTTHNEKADTINRRELAKLPGKPHHYKADIEGEFNERSYPADELLQLKEGAQVMFIKNDTGENRRYYNGKIGVIHSLSENAIQVSFPAEQDVLKLEKETWKNVRYQYLKEKDKIDEEQLGTFSQFPIRLAWAITIHKSQGLTFEKAVIDAGASFAPGQVYVALSRLTAIEGLVLKSRIYPHCIHTDERVLEFVKTEMSREVLQDLLEEGQQQFVKQSIVQAFSWEKINTLLRQHLDNYEGRLLPELNNCIDWATILIKAAENLGDIALKFQKQLQVIIDAGDNAALHERTKAACNYFIKETDNNIIASITRHIEEFKPKSRTKKYITELFDLRLQMERRKMLLKKVINLTGVLKTPGSGADALKAAEELYKPVVVEMGKEELQARKKKVKKGDTHRTSLMMFKDGKTIPEIAHERGLAIGTIETHLIGFISTGEVDVLEFVEEPLYDKISGALETHPEMPASELMQVLQHTCTYAQIRAVKAAHAKKHEDFSFQVSTRIS